MLSRANMKIILVDAIDGLIFSDGTIFHEMQKILDSYPNRKIMVTGANEEEFDRFSLNKSPYEVFTLKHNPEKTEAGYWQILLNKYNLNPEDVVYFEHNKRAAETAQSVGIATYFYDHTKKDLASLESFLDDNL